MLQKRKNIAKIVIVFCISALIAFVAVAQADNRGWDGEHFEKNQQHNFKRIAKKLGLTDAQKAQTKAIFQGNKEVIKPIITALRSEQLILRSLINAETIDIEAIRTETTKISGIQAEMNINRAKVGAQFRAILTPEQLTILKTLHKRGPAKEGIITKPVE